MAPGYDTAGDLTNDGIFAYTYDAESRLLSATGKGHTLAFDWDAEGRLATTTLDGTATSYDYNGTTPMGDWTGTAFATGQTQSRRHVFGAGGDPLYLTVNGVATYSHPDILGSTIALSNATASPVGALSAAFNYDPFGQPAVPLTSTFGYAGQRLEPTTGLIYDGARFYSPAWGRFYSPDPLGYAGGNNLYAYVGNDPLNNTDPFGLAAQQAGSSQWNLTTASSQSDLDQLNIRLFNARNAGNWSVVSQILAEIDNLTGAVTGPTAGPIAPPAQQTGPKLIGTFTVPENLKFGTTLFGNYAHLQAEDILRSLYGKEGLTFYVMPGQTGVDVRVDRNLIAKVGFAFAEIKPLSASGLRTYKRQIRRWGLDPNQTQAITYDANGNLFFGFQ